MAECYAFVAGRLNITPMFRAQSPISPGILIFPTSLADSILYVFVSDSADDSTVKIQDMDTGLPLSFLLPPEHAAIAVISKKDKKLVAKYGF